jgi:hypothetical protein
MHRDLGQVTELSRKVLDGRARPPVYLGRILSGEQCDLLLYRRIMRARPEP